MSRAWLALTLGVACVACGKIAPRVEGDAQDDHVTGEQPPAPDASVSETTHVVVVHTGWLAVGVYRQLASARGLGAEERYSFPYINWGPDRIAVGDVNGDGRPDVVGVDAKLAILYHH